MAPLRRPARAAAAHLHCYCRRLTGNLWDAEDLAQDTLLRAFGVLAFCPETMREIGSALGLHVRTGLYRYPTPAPGKSWSDAR